MSERNGQNFDPKIELIVGQYRRVVGALNELFLGISGRSEWEIWKQDGIGSCGIPKEAAQKGFSGIAKETLITLREELNSTNSLPRVEGKLTCPYHRKNHGCVIGELKAPVCIAYIENKEEVRERFGVEPYQLKRLIYDTARKVLFSGIDDESKVDPIQNEEFVEEIIGEIRGIVEKVRNSPPLDVPIKFIAQPEFG